MPLANDYRPKTLNEFIGSKDVIAALATKVQAKKPPHVYLFTGPSGCGKTTLSRIVAQQFGALSGTDNPNSAMDYKELDSADFRGIDTIRQIRKQMHTMPMRRGCKAYLLDECHQLTADAQEALLKALEETPPHVYFILATTNPEKLKETLKRRCTKFELDTLTDKQLRVLLKKVIRKEGKTVPKDVVQLIVQDSMGSPGIALSILETIIDLPAKRMRRMATKVAAEKNVAIDLCRALFKRGNWKTVSSILRGCQENKENPERLRLACLKYCASILIKQDSPAAYVVMEEMEDPMYDSPWEKMVLACYRIINAEDQFKRDPVCIIL